MIPIHMHAEPNRALDQSNEGLFAASLVFSTMFECIDYDMGRITIIPPEDNIRINTVDGYGRLHETWMKNIATWVNEINTEFHINIQDGAVYKAFLQQNGNWSSYLLSETTVAGKWKE